LHILLNPSVSLLILTAFLPKIVLLVKRNKVLFYHWFLIHMHHLFISCLLLFLLELKHLMVWKLLLWIEWCVCYLIGSVVNLLVFWEVRGSWITVILLVLYYFLHLYGVDGQIFFCFWNEWLGLFCPILYLKNKFSKLLFPISQWSNIFDGFT